MSAVYPHPECIVQNILSHGREYTGLVSKARAPRVQGVEAVVECEGLGDLVEVLPVRVVEQGLVSEVFHSPSHPYTRSLLKAIPRYDQPREKLSPVAEDLQSQLIDEARKYDQQRQV